MACDIGRVWYGFREGNDSFKNLKIEQQAKQEALRADLLRMISHDLRTPLTSISGNAGLLLENENAFSQEKKKELYQDIYNDAMWLYDLVETYCL